MDSKRIDPNQPHEGLINLSEGRCETLNYLKHSFTNFKDRSFREPQLMALDFIARSQKKFIVIEAPTGAGKSMIGMSAAQLFKNTIYAVHSKPLQVQLQRDFPEAAVLFGRSNYSCSMSTKLNCSECPLLRPMEDCTRGCPYKAAKRFAMAAAFRVLNYSYLLSEANYVGMFSKQNLIVLDEADSLEGVLYDFVTIAIAESTLKALHLKLPKEHENVTDSQAEEWKSWAVKVKDKVGKKAEEMNRTIASWSEIHTDEEKALVKRAETYKNILTKLDIFTANVDRSWQAEIKEGFRGGKTVHFKPLWLTPALTSSSLWRHSSKFILMSATFPPIDVLSRMLGINPKDIDYLSLPSTFPVENRRCIISPVANLTYHTQEIETPKILSAIRTILAKHPDEKGLIHTVNYRLAKNIMENITDRRLITHNTNDKQIVLDHFREANKPLVLVSPSSERGISLEDTQCRFIIMAKAPYLSLADKSVKARQSSGPIGNQWYLADMLLTVCQAMGRGVRHEADFCVSYLIDQQLAKRMGEHPSLLPPWFRDSLEYIDPQDLFGVV